MSRNAVRPGAMTVVLVFAIAGCSGDHPGGSGPTTIASPGADMSGAQPPLSTVSIEGKVYTCDEISNSTCGPLSIMIFDEYKDNIDTFVNAGTLGPVFNDSSYEDAAYAGLTACALALDGADAQEYVAWMHANYDDDLEGTSYLPVWFAAANTLCPGVIPL